MADPLSVAGAIVGLLSLGRHVTQDLVDFYSVYKNLDESFANITQNIENLQSTFRSLEIAVQHRLSQANAEELPQEFHKTTQRFQEIIRELHTECQKLRTDDRVGTEGRVRVAGNRAAYPFRRSTIQKIEEDVGEIRETLSLALNILQLKNHSRIEDETSSACDHSYRGDDSQSDMSHPPSVFSLLSRQSTCLTTNTRLTTEEIHSAIDELVGIFLEDKGLAILYREAIFERRIPRARFVRNFRRLLKRFAAGLKEEAGEAIDLDLANLVSSRADLVADKVGRKIEQQYSLSDTTSTREKLEYPAHPFDDAQSGSSADEDEGGKERALDEKIAALVSHGRSFIKESTAFQKLQEELKRFIMPSSSNKRLDIEPFVEVESRFEKWIRVVSPRTLATEFKNKASGWTKTVRLDLQELLAKMGLVEKGIPKSHQRFRWTNRHGRKLYDDYVIHETGALQALQEYLDATTVPGPTNAGPTNSQEQTSSRAASMYTPNSIPLSTGISSSINITDQPTIFPREFQSDITQRISELGVSSTGPLRLLSCIERRGRPVTLHQEIITDVTNDRELFYTLRRIYYNHRRKFESFYSLRTLHSIHFMKFWYGGHGLIDVRCHPEPCEPGKTCACIPPAHLVAPQGKDYACHPIPSQRSPPWGPNILMDFFKDPDSRKPQADTILQQLPKKMNIEADLDREEMMEAWGIYFREDWDWMRIWVVLGIAFFPPSLLFGIMWGILRQDIQGAFGVASWWMTGATIAVGIIGTCT